MAFAGPIPSLCEADAVLFDWDGVIAQTSLDFSHVREKYFGGRRAMLLEEAETLRPDVCAELMRDLDDLEKIGAENATPIGGADELIKLLEERDIPWAVVSRNSLESIEVAAATIGITLPDIVLSRDNSKYIKPDPRALTNAADGLGAAPQNVFFIGDFLYDMVGARRAAMRGVLVERYDEAWKPWVEVAFPTMADLYGAMLNRDDSTRFIPWEYRETVTKGGIDEFLKTFSESIEVRDAASLSICAMCELCSLGFGRIIVPDGDFTPDMWRRNPEIPVAYMGETIARTVSDFLLSRYPLVDVTR